MWNRISNANMPPGSVFLVVVIVAVDFIGVVFSDASSHLYNRPYLSVGWSVRNAFVKFGEKWMFRDF